MLCNVSIISHQFKSKFYFRMMNSLLFIFQISYKFFFLLLFMYLFQIEDNQMACLKVGIGFFDDKLGAQQQQAVVGILEHERPFTPFCLIGASCTGKTSVFIETTRQVASYQEETAPYEAM
jgi:hypothetical protein